MAAGLTKELADTSSLRVRLLTLEGGYRCAERLRAAEDDHCVFDVAIFCGIQTAKNKEMLYNKIPKSQIVTTSETTEYRKVVNTMGTNSKRINNETVLPKY